MDQTDTELVHQLDRTNKLIERLENHRYLQMVDRPWRFLGMSFAQGVAIALGSTLGFAVVIYLVSFILQKLQVFAPLSDRLDQIQQTLEQLPKN